jgi:hypothetical protein
MTREDRNRADARFKKAARAADEARSGKTDRDAALKAVTDNMARLKALRLAREAAQPAAPAATSKKARAKPKSSSEKSPDLADWLAGQQSGGRRI